MIYASIQITQMVLEGWGEKKKLRSFPPPGYDEDHPTIQFFWQVVAAFTPQQQHKLLQFVTGTDSVPLLGFSQLEPRFCIQLSHVDRDSDEANSDLPTASTCMNLLKLNPFLDPVLMREKLLYAIENCVGFELS